MLPCHLRVIDRLTIVRRQCIDRKKIAASTVIPLLPGSTMSNAMMSRRELWFAAYVAALHRVPPSDALAAADEALDLSDSRWRAGHFVTTYKDRYDYPVGHTFPNVGGSDAPAQ